MDQTAPCFFFSYTLIPVFIVVLQMPSVAQTNLTTDASALLSMKAHLSLHPHHILERNWTNSSISSVCSWIGITCGLRHRRVTALNVSDMGLSGTIPPHLGNLSFLISLDLGYNHFSGGLPQELSLLHRLKFISVEDNKLEGDIPSWLGLLPKLELLYLTNNSFSGVTPSAIFNISTLKAVHLGSNELSSNLPSDMCVPLIEEIVVEGNRLSGEITSNLSECSNLIVLSLAGNSFSGHIPSSIGKLQSLQQLYLGGNHINGEIPPEIGNLHNLVHLGIENNQISGTLPLTTFNISSLQALVLWRNRLSGKLPTVIANLTMLTRLELMENNFAGVLPIEIGKLHRLEFINLNSNALSGSIPPSLFNISSLQSLHLSGNNLSGTLPTNLCIGSPLLGRISFAANSLTGVIPHSISNCSHLTILELSSNTFTGFLPHFLANLTLIENINLANNILRIEPSSSQLTFITTLANCTFLKHLLIGDNPLHGIIPVSTGNLSSFLQEFSAPNCKIKGSIPHDMHALSNLTALDLSGNELSGVIPPAFKNLVSLQLLDLHSNNLEGPIPDGLCKLDRLYSIHLGQNQISGPIPLCLGNVSSLRHLLLHSNMLSSTIPTSLWHLKDLLTLDLSSNSLTGTLPKELGELSAANYVNLSRNNLSESIPSTIGNLQSLINLSLANNGLDGFIPVSVGSMISLVTLDLSCNNLSGSIPKSMEALRYLHYFNVSFNSLSGEIPSGGTFRNFSMDSFMGNVALCGTLEFSLCPVSKHKSTWKKVEFSLFTVAGVVVLLTVVTLAFIFDILRLTRICGFVPRRISYNEFKFTERISYYEILQATEHFNESNLLGKGSCGSVYKGVLWNRSVVAVKVFRSVQPEAAYKSFDVECEMLSNLRHRNITRVISSCSNKEFKALVLEYMPNSSLEKWLYSHNYFLDVGQRLNIMIDVATAMEYLHHGNPTPIVHCDLKPSNVLLDEDMIAHISDFGIAKLLGDGESTVLTDTLSTLGYIAPEYGLEGLVSTRCDVYSYGVMLMETFTRKKPIDEMFDEDLSMKRWVESLVPHSPERVIDANLLMNLDDQHVNEIKKCVSSILMLALKCSAESSRERINMKEALAELQKIKCGFIQ